MKSGSNLNIVFWLHLLIVFLAWTGPFLFTWWLIVLIYAGVQLQFTYLDKCVMNSAHGLEEKEDYTFYAFLLESNGIFWNRSKIKFFIRKRLKFILAGVAILWQVILGFKPFLF